jgi:hypothetical protein
VKNRASRLSVIIAASSIIAACGGGGGSPAVSTVPPPTYTAQSGVAQKGPLQAGSTVTAQELSAALSPTGKQYSYQITSDLGTFEPTSTFGSQYIGLTATGYYFDEVQNAISSGTVTLNAYADLSTQSVLNVNLLTTLAYQRTEYLVANSGLSVDAAMAQAEKEVLAVFNIRNEEGTGSFSAYDLSADTDGGHILEAISSMFVYGNTAGQLSALIAKFQSDIVDTGTISDATTLNALAAAAKALDPGSIASNLTSEYASAGITFSASDISEWLDQSGDGLIGKYKFSTSDATASTAYTSPAYVIGPDDPTTCSATNGTLYENGSAVSAASITVAVGDSLTLSLTSGPRPADTVSGYINCGSIHVAEFSVQTKPLTLSLIGTISDIGAASYVALSADNKTLFVSAFDSCDLTNSCATPADDGGLYSFDVTSPANPQKLALATYLSPNYHSATNYAVVLSADGATAFVGDGGGYLDAINVSNPAAPSLSAQLPVTCQAYGEALSPDGFSLFLTTSCESLSDIDVENPGSPTINSDVSEDYQSQSIAVSPDETQVVLGGGGATEVFSLAGTSFGAPVDLTGTFPSSALTYVGNETLALLSASGSTFSILNLSNPVSPSLVGSVAIVAPASQAVPATAGAVFLPATNFVYVKYQSTVMVVDVSVPSSPVVRGSLALGSGGPGSPSVHDGVAISSDGTTLYVTNNGDVSVVNIGQ